MRAVPTRAAVTDRPAGAAAGVATAGVVMAGVVTAGVVTAGAGPSLPWQDPRCIRRVLPQPSFMRSCGRILAGVLPRGPLSGGHSAHLGAARGFTTG